MMFFKQFAVASLAMAIFVLIIGLLAFCLLFPILLSVIFSPWFLLMYVFYAFLFTVGGTK